MSRAESNSTFQLAGQQKHLWNDFEGLVPTESYLISAALALGAEAVAPWSEQEITLVRAVRKLKPFSKASLSILRDLVHAGFDPLGEAFCSLRTSEQRRSQGAIYTPEPIVKAIIDWAAIRTKPGRIVDPGTGSGRFLMKAANAFSNAGLIGIESDPVAALMARANLAVTGVAARSRVIVGDYRRFDEPYSLPTLYIGNPPYVRHHQIDPKWKEWLFHQAAKLGYKASKLAGLHIYFFLATVQNARPGDFGAFVTAAEWLDVNYGALVRSLFLKDLGGQSITVIEPTAQPFPDAATTAAITCFEIGSKPSSIVFRRVKRLRDLDTLGKGRRVHRDRLTSQSRWSYLTHVGDKPPEGYIELGELCRVHRGQVTGSNEVWIAGKHSAGLPNSVLFRTITRAREVFAADGVLADASKLRCVIDLPVDLDELECVERHAVDSFLERACEMGGDRGYVASHRKAWWAVGLRAPAPIISTYMARRPPAFVVNAANARHINIAHGLYPLESLSETAKTSLVQFMQVNVSQRSGRTYAGGLTKFEPREMERLIVPGLAMLNAGVCK